jgi:hypothetical protein
MRTWKLLWSSCVALLVATGAGAQSNQEDTTFNTTGLLVLPWTPMSIGAREVVAIAPDGSMFIVHEGTSDLSVAHLDTFGVPIPSYVGGGIARIALTEPLGLSAVHVAADGALIIGGGRDLLRVDPSGRLDESFGNMGRMRIPYVTDGSCAAGDVLRILPTADGAWIVVGRRFARDVLIGVIVHEGGCTLVARVKADGTPDLSFGTQGNTVRPGLIGFDAVLRAEGTIEVIGRYAGRAGSWVERLRADGRMFDSYGVRGSLMLAENGPPIDGVDGRILADGSRIVVSDATQGTTVLHRYRADDTFDPQFAGLGRTVLALRDSGSAVRAVLALPDGGFLVRTEVITPNSFSTFYKVDARGFPDRSFGDAGYLRHVSAGFSRFLAWAAQPDGYVVFTVASFSPPATPIWRAYAARIQAVPDIVEFRNAFTNHYFIVYDGLEATGIDDGAAGPGWQRTLQRFRPGGLTPVCRFYNRGANTHFFTVEPGECEDVKHSPGWSYEGLGFYSTRLAAGKCAAPLQTVYRLFNNRQGFNDSNHRYVTDLTLVPGMVAQGWSLEGAVFCAKP